MWLQLKQNYTYSFTRCFGCSFVWFTRTKKVWVWVSFFFLKFFKNKIIYLWFFLKFSNCKLKYFDGSRNFSGSNCFTYEFYGNIFFTHLGRFDGSIRSYEFLFPFSFTIYFCSFFFFYISSYFFCIYTYFGCWRFFSSLKISDGKKRPRTYLDIVFCFAYLTKKMHPTFSFKYYSLFFLSVIYQLLSWFIWPVSTSFFFL